MSVRDGREGNEGSTEMSGAGGGCVRSGGVSGRGLLQAPWSYLRASGRPPMHFPILFLLLF